VRKVVIALGAILLAIGAGILLLARAEEQDALCASCHSQPETTYVHRTLASRPVDLASAHALAGVSSPTGASERAAGCIDCHSAPGVRGRAQAMALGARDALKWIAGLAQQPAISTTPIGDQNCLKCHADALTASRFDRHFHRLLPRWQQTDPRAGACVSCHAAHTIDGEAGLGFLARPRTEAVCEDCHRVMEIEGEGRAEWPDR